MFKLNWIFYRDKVDRSRAFANNKSLSILGKPFINTNAFAIMLSKDMNNL